MTQLFVFDLDGTLVDSGAQIVRAMRCAFDAVDRPPPRDEEVLAIVGLSLPAAVSRLAAEVPVDDHPRIVEAYRGAFLSDPAPPRLYPGAADALHAMSARGQARLAVATGKALRGLLRVLDHLALTSLFDNLQAGDEHPSKPDPAMLRAALAAARVTPERATMIGDSVYDVEMARAAGVRPIGVAWGYYSPDALREAGAERILSSFEELADALETSA